MSRTILLVDDSAVFRTVTAQALTKAGYATVQAVDGQDALDKVRDQRFDLIISDINMPNMDGLALLKALKSRPGTKFTPVLMLTTEAAGPKMNEARANGAKAWITKPFQVPQLVSTVATLLRA
jgi:two-component system, chemotaxis family, chemotaxis protein CheY